MVSSLGLTHPLAAAQAGGFTPRRWLPGFLSRATPAADVPLVFGCLSVGLDPACVHTCAGARARDAVLQRRVCRCGPCTYLQARVCTCDGSLCISQPTGVHVRPSAPEATSQAG